MTRHTGQRQSETGLHAIQNEQRRPYRRTEKNALIDRMKLETRYAMAIQGDETFWVVDTERAKRDDLLSSAVLDSTSIVAENRVNVLHGLLPNIG